MKLYERSYALVIGIDGYSNGWPKLRNAIVDAKAIAGELEQRGFEVTLATDPNAADLDRIIRSFFNGPGADPEARLLIWFAGHGYSLPRRFEKNVYDGYLIPTDAPVPPIDTVKQFRETGAFKDRAYAIARIGLLMKQAAAKHIIAIMDSCFSGTVFETRSGGAKITPEITKRTIEPVRQMISSGTVGQEVSDNGLFRKLFLDAITGREQAADTNKDGFITGGELGRFLSYQVAKYSGNTQTPRIGKLKQYGLDRGDFVFQVTKKNAQVANLAPDRQSKPRDSRGRGANLVSCIGKNRQLGRAALTRVAERFRGRKHQYGWRTQTKERGSDIEWKSITSARLKSGYVELAYAWRGGRLRLAPVAGKLGNDAMTLAGTWTQSDGAGCAIFQFSEDGSAAGAWNVDGNKSNAGPAFLRVMPAAIAHRGKPACTKLTRNLPRRYKIAKGDAFCSPDKTNTARVADIVNRAVIFDVNGRKFTCLQGELCAFNWPDKPLFRITARADKAKGIAPDAIMLPR